jgi:hypothetical protein
VIDLLAGLGALVFVEADRIQDRQPVDGRHVSDALGDVANLASQLIDSCGIGRLMLALEVLELGDRPPLDVSSIVMWCVPQSNSRLS